MTQWGAWHDTGGNGMRVGVDVAVSTVTQSSSTVTFTYDVWTENRYLYNDLQWLTFVGGVTGEPGRGGMVVVTDTVGVEPL